jgi:hypothetical protein
VYLLVPGSFCNCSLIRDDQTTPQPWGLEFLELWW